MDLFALSKLGSHSCVLVTSAGGSSQGKSAQGKPSGAVRCWGRGDINRRPDNNSPDTGIPKPIAGLESGIVAIGAGYEHGCALTSAGGVKCWGRNSSGVLGDGSFDGGDDAAVQVFGLESGVVSIAVAATRNCALTSTGAVKCWGYSANGELGDGKRANRCVPTQIPDLGPGVRAITAGHSHICAITSSGGAMCWGTNSDGQIGDDTGKMAVYPAQVVGLQSGVLAISAGSSHTCAIVSARGGSSGGVKCWGGNSSGQLGDGSTDKRYVPIPVAGLESGVVAISTRQDNTCAMTSAGKVMCFGASGGRGMIEIPTNRKPVIRFQ